MKPELVDLLQSQHRPRKGLVFRMCRSRLRNSLPRQMCCICASSGGGLPSWDLDAPCTYSLFNKAYNRVDTAKYNPNKPRMIGLSRAVANELVLAAVLHPLMMTDIGCKYHPFVFATDASSKRGAICRCPVGPTTAEVLWKTSKSKGSYTRLLSPSEELLRRLGIPWGNMSRRSHRRHPCWSS